MFTVLITYDYCFRHELSLKSVLISLLKNTNNIQLFVTYRIILLLSVTDPNRAPLVPNHYGDEWFEWAVNEMERGGNKCKRKLFKMLRIIEK